MNDCHFCDGTGRRVLEFERDGRRFTVRETCEPCGGSGILELGVAG